VVIRVRKAGVCATDLEVIRGYYGYQGVMGHEFVGVAETGRYQGQRVAGEINLSCGECAFCLKGMPTHCPTRTVLGIVDHDGAFADYLTLPEANLHLLPETLGDDQAVFVEPVAAAFQTLECIHISPHDRVVLLGDGRLGLLTAQVVSLTGCDLTVVGKHERKLSLAEDWGIDAQFVDDIQANSADIVIDCTGNPGGFADALEWVRPRGSILLKSTYHGLPEADLTRVVVDEITVIGSRCGPFPAAIKALAQGTIKVGSMIDAHYNLDDGVAALEHAATPGTLKIILDVV
jgi:threonine dehydrogenase-like Zn-dependent dehydrogenase